MNCYLHPDTAASAFCRSCGRPLCPNCQQTSDGTVFCQEHFPGAFDPSRFNPGAFNEGSAPGAASAAANPYTQPQRVPSSGGLGGSPILAFILGWIPGVGAIYNGQYIKGLVHAVIFGVLVSILSSYEGGASQPFLGVVLGAFVFYMPFEAYHTAKKRQMGIAVDEWSSLVSQGVSKQSRAPVGPIVLIAIGVLFLLDTLHLVEFREIGRFWPVLLIAVGAYMLYSRVTAVVRTPTYPPQQFNNPVSTDDGSEALGARREQ